MCDCYTDKCVNCGCDISLHIGDFSTSRENILPYCHRCTRKILNGKLSAPQDCKLFEEKGDKRWSKEQIQGLKEGDIVHIYSKDHNAYDVYLN